MRASSDEVILSLDAALQSPQLREYIREALQRTVAALQASDRLMTWETVPLDLFEQLPPSIQSCWVFVLRAAQDTGAERHPNSHQRSLSLSGSGHYQVREQGEWKTYALSSEPSTVDNRWATIPVNAWHRWLVGSEPWAVLSFHTVPDNELIEERPLLADDLDSSTEQRLYQE